MQRSREVLLLAVEWLKRFFDATATWVTQLSWWKFFLFAILALAAAGILQEHLFSPDQQTVVIHKNQHGKPSDASGKTYSDGETNIKIDSTGIHITKRKPGAGTPGTEAAPPATPPTPATPSTPGTPVPPASAASGDATNVNITLPPDVAREVNDAIAEAVNDASEREVIKVRAGSQDRIAPFVLLLVFFLFGTKVLMGGKKRAEAQAQAANAKAERETLQRQVTEARMQMMQAQVEPHFLFNTLASVEHLIETDPPRASAMQHSLIQYLRAVLPQIRESAPVTNLGREADMVKAYLDLLKMRMEERLTVVINVPDGLRSAAFPPMMLQSLVENAIQHGLENKPEGGSLRLHAEVAHNKLRVTVADDGLGFGATPSTGTGLGLQSIRERLALLHGHQAQLIIAPNGPSGVCATIELPYQLASH
jgi:signal transduction histidine kinase